MPRRKKTAEELSNEASTVGDDGQIPESESRRKPVIPFKSKKDADDDLDPKDDLSLSSSDETSEDDDDLSEEFANEGEDGQQALPTMEVPRNIPLETAAMKYAKCRDRRLAEGKKEKEAKEFLIKLMMKDKIPVYSFDGIDIRLSNKPDVKVSTAKDDDDHSEEDDEKPDQE